MVLGVAIIKVMPGSERSVYHAVRCNDDVLDIYYTFGEFDFFVILQADGLGKLNDLIGEFQEINGIVGVKRILISRKDSLQEYEPLKVLA